METIIKKSIKVPFDEFAAFLHIDPDKIAGGFIAEHSKYIEIYLND